MLFKPSLVVPDVTSIDLDLLLSYEIKGFLFDLDNTVMAPHTGCLEPRIEHWLAHIQSRGFQSVIVTNNKKLDYCEAAGKTLGLPVVHYAKKPRRGGFRKGLEMLGLEPRQVAVVGDRPLTDIWGGLRLGAYTILVDPLTKETEPEVIKFLRALERSLVRI